MQIPKKVKIGANTFAVIRKPVSEVSMDHDGGWTDWEQNKLFLGDDMPEDREATVFLHEILHGLNVYLTEEQVTYLSEGLIQIIRDNDLDFRFQARQD